MSGKAGRWGIPIVAILSTIAVLYLLQHSWSVRLTQQLAKLEKERRLLVEEVESYEVELRKLQSFSRLESLALYGPSYAEFTPEYQKVTKATDFHFALTVEP